MPLKAGEFESPSAASSYRRWLVWLLELVIWDGLLPFLVLWTPKLLRFFAGPPANGRPFGVVELVSLAVPVAGFTYRFVIGMTAIKRNGFLWQRLVFVVGLCLLALAETAFILIEGDPRVPDDPMVVCAPLYLMYFFLMAVAFLPVRPE